MTLTVWPVLAVGLLFADEPFRSADDVQKWLTYYYLKPRPELALQSLSVMDRELQARKGRSLADEVSRGGLRSFYARVFADNPKVASEAGAALRTLPDGQRAFVIEGLGRCGTPACKSALPAASAQARPSSPDPGTLDDSWASFFATGDAQYVREVIEVLSWVEVRGDVNRMLTGGAARWSLASNAYQHTRVLSILEEELVTGTDKGDAARAHRRRESRARQEPAPRAEVKAPSNNALKLTAHGGH